jgi:hypothetical protein
MNKRLFPEDNVFPEINVVKTIDLDQKPETDSLLP